MMGDSNNASRTVVVDRGSGSNGAYFGFSLALCTNGRGVRIVGIRNRTAGEDTEGLRVGWIVSSIDGTDVTGASLEEVVAVLVAKSAAQSIALVILPPPPNSELHAGVVAWTAAANDNSPGQASLTANLRKLVSGDFTERKLLMVANWVEEVMSFAVNDGTEPSLWPTENSSGRGVRFNSKGEVAQAGIWEKGILLPVALGRLTKLGGMRKSWKTRIFELKFDTLSYYEDTPCGELCGELKVSRIADVEPADNDPVCGRPNSFRITMQDRSGRASDKERAYYMVAESKECCDLWIAMILEVKDVLGRLNVAETPDRTTRRERRSMMVVAAPAVVGITISAIVMGIGRKKNPLKLLRPSKEGENRLCWSIPESQLMVCPMLDTSIKSCIDRMAKGRTEDSTLQAIKILDIISSVAANKDTVAACGAIPNLVKLLESSNSEVAQTAAAVLSHLVIGSKERSAEAYEAGAIKPTVTMLRDWTKKEESVYATGVLFGLARGPDSRKNELGTDDIIMLLVSDLEIAKEQGRAWAAGTLLHLANGSDDRKSKIEDAGAITPLVALLSCAYEEARLCAAGALLMLAEDNENRKRKIVESGALKGLMEVAQNGNEIANMFAIDTILHLLDGPKEGDGAHDPATLTRLGRVRNDIGSIGYGVFVNALASEPPSASHVSSADILLKLATNVNELDNSAQDTSVSNPAVSLASIASSIVSKGVADRLLAVVQAPVDGKQYRRLGFKNLTDASEDFKSTMKVFGAPSDLFE